MFYAQYFLLTISRYHIVYFMLIRFFIEFNIFIVYID